MANENEVKTQENVSAEVVKKDSKVVAPEKTKKVKVNKKKVVKEKKVGAMSKTFSELKKVTWPSFGTVVKQTAVVIVVTLVFLLVIFGLDKLCSWLIGLICS